MTSDRFAFVANLIVGLILVAAIGFFIGLAAYHHSGGWPAQIAELKAQAIEHNCAAYDAKTGAWAWKP